MKKLINNIFNFNKIFTSKEFEWKHKFQAQLTSLILVNTSSNQRYVIKRKLHDNLWLRSKYYDEEFYIVKEEDQFDSKVIVNSTIVYFESIIGLIKSWDYYSIWWNWKIS